MLITPRAKQAIESQGGNCSGQDVKWPEGTKPISAADHGAWGTLSVRIWRLPNGQGVIWDSDDREYRTCCLREV